MRNHLTRLAGLIVLLGLGGFSAAQDEGIASAEQSFHYLAATLQTFRNSGRLVNNPGIDGADFEHFIELLEEFHSRFLSGIGPDSALCRFYRDPENGRMTIEERAEIAYGFLPSLENRLRRYLEIDAAFQQAVANSFGTRVLDRINQIKTESVSNQMLPTWEYDEAARINFADGMCI